MLSIRLFGSPQVSLDQRRISLTRRKSRALLYYLAAHTRPLKREHLLAFFWPDADRASAQQTLRTTLHALRKSLGPVLVVEDDSIALATDTEVDARSFETQLSAATSDVQRLTATLELYRADFLADFTLPDSPEFDGWAAVERERYRRLMVRGLMALSRLYESQQNFSDALDALNRALAFDPLQEDLQRAALRLHYLAGDRAGAIRRYENFRKLLDDEMGVPPMAETRAMYDAIITDTLELPTPHPRPRRAGRAPRASGTYSQSHKGTATLFPTSNFQRLTSNLQPPTSNALPFTGRAVELQRLSELDSSHKLALIEGEAGIGKTRLAEEFIMTAGALALVGRARELEHALPYQPVIEALRGLLSRPDWPALRADLKLLPVWRAEVARLLPELALSNADIPAHDESAPASISTSDGSRLWEGLYQFLRALSLFRATGEGARIIFFLDDLHWADASTLALLGYLVRQVASTQAPIRFVATTRLVDIRSPLATLLQTLMREGRLERLALQRLSPNDTTQLAQHLSPTFAPALADWLTRVSEGNPYILSEWVREAREKNILRPDGTLQLDAFSASPVVPQTVYSLIQSRLARLSDAARRVLDVAVAVGREFEVEVVERAAGLSETAVLDALDELRAASLIAPLDALRYTFDHTLTMEVAYREAGEPRHRRFHRRVAEAMEHAYRHQLDAVAGLLAWHFAEGNAPERAAPYAFRAGQNAARLPAWKEAIAFYEQALQAESDEVKRKEIYMALGEAHLQFGESAQASEWLRAALALALAQRDGAAVDAARLALSRSLLGQARFAEALELAQQVLETGSPDNAVMAEFAWGTALSLEGADLDGAAEHLQRAASRIAPSDPIRLAQIKFELGGVEAQQGNLERAIALYREALEAARATKNEAASTWRSLAHNNLAYHLHLLGDPSAIEHARAGLSLAREKGALFVMPYLLSTLGEIALAQNDLDTAEAHFNEGLALAERLSAPERITGLTANLGLVAQRRGQTVLAIHHLSTALARADALGLQHLAAQIRLWLVPLLPPHEAQTRLAEAKAIVERGNRRRLMEEVRRLEEQI